MAYKNKEDIRAYNRRYRETHKAELKAHKRRYYEAHKAEYKRYREAHKAEYNTCIRKWRKTCKTLVFQILGNRCKYENEYCSGRLEREHPNGNMNNQKPNEFDKEVLAGKVEDKQAACHHHNHMKNDSNHEFLDDCKAIYLASLPSNDREKEL